MAICFVQVIYFKDSAMAIADKLSLWQLKDAIDLFDGIFEMG
jgi:hypothetical protein